MDLLQERSTTAMVKMMPCLSLFLLLMLFPTPGFVLQNHNIPELTVQSSGAAIEGREVKLSCNSSYILGQNFKILWRKNGKTLPHTQTNSNELIFSSIRIEDEGDYSCALEGQEDHPSPPVKLNVMYLPRNVSVSVHPPGGIVEGASVTLTCSSDANPPAVSYTWYASCGTVTQSSLEQIFRIPSITSRHRGCNYYCVAANKHGDGSSTPAHLDVQYSGSAWQHVALTAGGALFLLAAVLMVALAVLWRRKKMISLSSVSRSTDRSTDRNTDVWSPGLVDTFTNSAELAADNDPDQEVDSGDSDDVRYASVQLKSSREEQMLLNSTVKLQPENVVYATVNV